MHKTNKRLLPLMLILLITLTLWACGSGGIISEVHNPDAINAPRYSSIDAIDFPQSVEVTLEDGGTQSVEVLWNTGEFDGSKVGTITVPGTIVSDAHDNPDDLRATQAIEIEPVSLSETLQAQDDYDLFVTALEESGIASELGEGPHTYFAPTNDVFEDLMDAFDLSEREFMNLGFLETIVERHIVEGNYGAADFQDGTIESIGGEMISVSANDAVVLDDEAVIIEGDIKTTEGMVHGIDDFLGDDDAFGGIDEDFFDDETFEILLESLEEAGLGIEFFLNEDYTLFLPNEAAIDAFADSLDKTPEELLELDELPELLANHVVEETFTIDEIVDELPKDVTTYADETYTIDEVDGAFMIDDATILGIDDFEGDIFFHEIDKVLVPESIEDDLYN